MYGHSSRQCSACGDVTRVLVASYNLNQTGCLNGRVSSDLTPREVRETLCRMSLSGTLGDGYGKGRGDTEWENQALSEISVSKMGNDTAMPTSSEQCFASRQCIRMACGASKL